MLWYETTINCQFPIYPRYGPSMYYLVPLVGILANSAFQRNAQDIQCNLLYGDVYPEHSSEKPYSLVSWSVIQGGTSWDKQKIDTLWWYHTIAWYVSIWNCIVPITTQYILLHALTLKICLKTNLVCMKTNQACSWINWNVRSTIPDQYVVLCTQTNLVQSCMY